MKTTFRKHFAQWVAPLAMGLLCAQSEAQQQAIVNFNNNAIFNTMADRRVYSDFVGGTPLVGTNWGAQLYYGATASTLGPVMNAPAFFRPANTPVPGTWAGGTRTLNGFAQGETLTLQVRVWDRSMYPNYETAVAAGGGTAVSAPFLYTMRLSDPPHPSDITMENLRAFSFSSLPPPTNRPPVAHAQSVSTPEDTARSITLSGSDPDGDPLTFSIPAAQSAQGGTLTHSAGVVQYTPPEDFFGEDQFGFIVSDGQATASGTIRISVTSVNDPPTAVAHVGPLFGLTLDETNSFILSINGWSAAVVLDASQSSDVDTESLGFIWSTGDPPTAFVRGEVVTNLFAVGTHSVTLEARDGIATDHTTVEFEVITLGDAVGMLLNLVDNTPLPRKHQRALIATLKSAARSAEQGDVQGTLNDLDRFVNKVDKQLAPTHPDEATVFLHAVNALIASIEAQEDLLPGSD